MGRRFVILDYMHRVYKTVAVPPLSHKVNFNGTEVEVDTTIPTHTIKAVFSFSGKGSYPIVVCLEGGCPDRVAYFAGNQPTAKKGEGYKDGRGRLSSVMRDGIELAVGILNDGGVACAMEIGAEADDYIINIVAALKQQGITDPIDVITGDRDMLPLVDEQVSVYMNNPRTYSEPGCPSLRGYFQVTPRSWDSYISYASEYKGFDIPYNAVLLYKMIRGDKADNIKGLKGYGGVKFSSIVAQMREAGCPFDRIFRYGVDFDTMLAPLLNCVLTPEEVEVSKFIYTGISPRVVAGGDITKLVMPRQIDVGKLQRRLLDFGIHLPI